MNKRVIIKRERERGGGEIQFLFNMNTTDKSDVLIHDWPKYIYV